MHTAFDLFVFIVIIASAVTGFERGLVGEAFHLASLIIGGWLAVRFYAIGASLIGALITLADGVLAVVGFMLVFIVVNLAIQLIGLLARSLIRSLHLAWLDRLSGTIFGIAKGLLFSAALVWLIAVFRDHDLYRLLHRRSMTFQLLETFEIRALHLFGLERQALNLEKDIRELLRLDPQKILTGDETVI